MFVKALQIRGFRRNKRLDIVFGPITTIWGESFKGKSSIIGALKWVLFNTPSGNRFINWDCKRAAVRLTLSNGVKIIRRRTPKENVYQIDRGGKIQTFRSLKRGIPPKPVLELLRLSPINFKRQHAGHFWFSESSTEVGRQLNQIVSIGIVDRLLNHLTRQERTEEALVKDSDARIADALHRKQRFRSALNQDEDLKRLESHAEKIEKTACEARGLTILINRVRWYTRKRDRLTGMVLAIQKMSLQLDKLRKTTLLASELTQIVDSTRDLHGLANRTVPDVESVRRKVREIETNQSRSIELRAIIESIRANVKRQTDIQTEIDRVRKELTSLVGNVCPVCNQSIQRGDMPWER